MKLHSPTPELRRFSLSLVGYPRTIRRITRSCAPVQDLKGLSVAVIGLGKSGRAAARLALTRGASVLAIDQDEKLSPLEQDPLFEHHCGLRTIFGRVDVDQIKDADRIIVSPGVPLEKYGLLSLLQSGRQVMSELDFAAEALPKSVKILAVTGTNGKSTVVTFAAQMLDHFGIETSVGGNLGNPLSDAAYQCIKTPSAEPIIKVAIVEVSSYQMEIPCKHFHPSVSVILNLTPDHLERHKTMRNYAACKCRLLSAMINSKLGLVPYGAKVANIFIPAIGVALPLHLERMKTMGTHNYQNAAVALVSVLGLDFGINPSSFQSTTEKLSPPPHRMEVCKDPKGVTWVDDSKATNVESTLVGIKGLEGQKGRRSVHDGEDSNGFGRLVESLNHHKCAITFGHSGKQIHQTLCANGLRIPSFRVDCLKDAVKLARELTNHGDTVLLIPGCASFDEFKNFEHRGNVFKELAMSL